TKKWKVGCQRVWFAKFWVSMFSPFRSRAFAFSSPLQIRRHRVGSRRCVRSFRQLRREVFARVYELVPLEMVLLVVELFVAAVGGEQLFMRAALNNFTSFQHQNLIGAANGGEPVCNNKGGAASTQRLQAILNQRFAFAVETRSGFVKD